MLIKYSVKYIEIYFNLKLTFHSVCTVCRCNDCDRDSPCTVCSAMDGNTLSTYLKHRLRLQSKSQYKLTAKATASAPVPVLDVADPVPSPDRSVSLTYPCCSAR